MWLKLTPAKSVPEVVKKSTNQRVRLNRVLGRRVLQLRGKLKLCFQNQKCFYYTVKTLLSKLFLILRIRQKKSDFESRPPFITLTGARTTTPENGFLKLINTFIF